MTVHSDHFNGTEGALIHGRSLPVGGGTWNDKTGSGANFISQLGGFATPNAVCTPSTEINVVNGVTAEDLNVSLIRKNNRPIILVRVMAANTYYRLITHNGTIYKVVAGTATLIGDGGNTNVDSKAELRVRKNGASTDLDYYIDDVLNVSVNDATAALQGAGEFGFSGDNNGSRLDNWAAETFDAPAAGITIGFMPIL